MKRLASVPLPLALLVLAVLAAVVVAVPARGNPPCVAAYAPAPVAAAPQYQQAYTPVLAAVFVPVPSYTVGLTYAAPAPAADPADPAAAMSATARELAALRAEVAALKAARPVPAQAPRPAAPKAPPPIPHAADAPADGWGVLSASCASCHAGGQAKGGFRYDPAALTPEGKVAILDAVFSGRMPPKAPPLPGPQKAALLASLGGR